MVTAEAAPGFDAWWWKERVSWCFSNYSTGCVIGLSKPMRKQNTAKNVIIKRLTRRWAISKLAKFTQYLFRRLLNIVAK